MATNRTAFFVRRTNGMHALEDLAMGTGARIFVHYTNGTDAAGYGNSPDSPVKTLDYAIGLCTANKGDIIFLMPGHAEDLATATSCVVDVAGVQVIGIGNGSLQPTLTLKTATTAVVSVTAADCRFKNIKFISDIANLAIGLDLTATADGAVVENCLLMDGAANKEMKIMINVTAACHNVEIKNNRFIGFVDNDADTNAILFAGASNYSRVIGNFLHGLWLAAPIAASAAASLSMIIADNVVNNADATAGLTITSNAATTGLAVRNLCLGAKDAVHLTLAAMMVAENYDSNAAGASAIIKPAVDS